MPPLVLDIIFDPVRGLDDLDGGSLDTTATTVFTMSATVVSTIPRIVAPTVYPVSGCTNYRASEMRREHVDLDDETTLM